MDRPAKKPSTAPDYAEYAAKLRFFCRQKGLRLRRLGLAGGHPLFQVVGGPRRASNTVVFSAGIHGDEISGPLGILELIRTFDWGDLRRTRLIMLPVANPWGFANGRRCDAAGHDLNRGFAHKRLRRETRRLHDVLKKERPALFFSLHEDDEEPSFYMYAYGDPGEDSPVRRIIKAAGRRHIPLTRSRRIDGRPARGGVIFNVHDGSFEHRARIDGAARSICLELPDKRPLTVRIKAAAAVMSALLRHYESLRN